MSQKLPHLTGGIAGVMGGNHDFIGRTRIWDIIYPTYRINIDGFGEITVSKVGYIPGQTTFITPLYCDR